MKRNQSCGLEPGACCVTGLVIVLLFVNCSCLVLLRLYFTVEFYAFDRPSCVAVYITSGFDVSGIISQSI